MKKVSVVLALLVTLLVLANEVQVSTAVNCVIQELLPCLNAATTPALPSALCCTKLSVQRPCFCQYLKNPTFKSYLNTSNAQKITNTCRFTPPNC
ncbi:hypothetical protein GIB67_036354 [Kingdonia uniflora]|uniref:Bifunctional inhibitor/plant lipid transfer protein/seed storage helical domain-containing protein n=1 Tax=Kingdonia uniflora TaxID=39325 RepID=A0A7J7L3Z3_9MAGN|nr:hypothetical protein GIB67_036354 [Kingdonia uniflora]